VLVVRRLIEGDEAAFLAALARETETRDSDTVLFMGHEAGTRFDAYLAYLRDAERGVGLPSGWVPFTMLFAFVGDELIGRASLRHELNEFLATVGGHIGYLVLTDHRRRGYGTEILAQTLAEARARELSRVLLTCNEDNAPSQRMIEHAGGVFESLYESPDGSVRKRRYWIELGVTASRRGR
jgi:predicted acetyltransferase